MASREENNRDTSQAQRRSHGTDQKQSLASNFVDDRHRYHGEDQIRTADRHRLKIARNLAETSMAENVVQVIKDGIDAGELVKHSNAHRQKDWKRVTPGEQPLGGQTPLNLNRFDNILQVVL